MAVFVVTGGAGFIGSHLTDALLDGGHKVLVLDDLSTGRRANLDPRAELIVGDVADAALCRSVLAGCDGCFHLAAIASVARSNEDWVGTHRTNMLGTVAVFDAARAAGNVPVVYASSAAIYGDQNGKICHESASPRPMTAYGADKLGAELHGAVAFGVHRVPTLGFRFFNVFGPRQDPSSPYSGVISIFAARVAARKSLTINGDGQQTRDFVYVTDVVEHLIAGMAVLLRKPGCSVLNVCTGRETTVLGLAQALSEISGLRTELQFGPPRDGDIRVSVGNPDTATAALGVRAETSLAAGLATTFAYLQAEAAALAKTKVA